MVANAVQLGNYAAVGLAVAGYLATRAPLLPLGFGSDSDAWSVADVARTLGTTGVYAPSRLPGHPVHELLAAAIIPLGGALGMSFLSLASSVFLLAVTLRLGRHFGGDALMSVVVALAVHPWFWISSADGTDFILATTLAYGGLLAAARDNAFVGGVLLALACGTRVETAVFVPLAIWGHPRRHGPSTAVLLGSCAVVATLLYLPAGLHYYKGGGDPADVYVSAFGVRTRLIVFGASVWAACGLLPICAAMVLLAVNGRRLARLLAQRNPLLLMAAYVAAVMLLVAFIHPTKPRYFLPIVPIGLLALGTIGGRRWMAPIIVSLVSYCFVYPDIVDRDGDTLKFGLRANNGLVTKEWIARWNTLYVASAVDAAHEPGDVLVLGYWLPIWRWTHPEARPIWRLASGTEINAANNAAFELADGATVVHKLNCRELESVQQSGGVLRYAEGIDGFIRQTYQCPPPSGPIVMVRDFGSDVSEQFSLMCLIRCGSMRNHERFATCARDCMTPSMQLGAGPGVVNPKAPLRH